MGDNIVVTDIIPVGFAAASSVPFDVSGDLIQPGNRK